MVVSVWTDQLLLALRLISTNMSLGGALSVDISVHGKVHESVLDIYP